MYSHEMLGAAACPCNPRSGEVETGGPLSIVGHPCSGQIGELQVQVETLFQKLSWGFLKETAAADLLSTHITTTTTIIVTVTTTRNTLIWA